MLTRRSFVGAFALGCTCRAGQAFSWGEGEASGACYLAPQTIRSRTFGADDPELLAGESRLDDPNLKKNLGRALARLSRFFDVAPAFGFYDDRNAQASPAVARNAPGTWGTVLLGAPLLNMEMERDPTGMTILAVLAHEFGHIVQYRTATDALLARGQTTHKRIELHADILAGYFIGARKREEPELSVYTAGEIFYRIGDSDFSSPTHHGAPEERKRASQFGFERGVAWAMPLSEMIAAGVRYVSSA